MKVCSTLSCWIYSAGNWQFHLRLQWGREACFLLPCYPYSERQQSFHCCCLICSSNKRSKVQGSWCKIKSHICVGELCYLMHGFTQELHIAIRNETRLQQLIALDWPSMFEVLMDFVHTHGFEWCCYKNCKKDWFLALRRPWHTWPYRAKHVSAVLVS